MACSELLSRDLLRDRFAVAISAMYHDEVPAYASLVKLVENENVNFRSRNSKQSALAEVEDGRVYHGAIRLGSAKELRMIRRAFAIMGMYPVGYYDLSTAGLPVHSTAFRPTSLEALEINPFRVFTSLLRLDMLNDEVLKRRAVEVLSRREVFTTRLVELIEIAEIHDGLTDEQADEFVLELLETFRWRKEASVSIDDYRFFEQPYRLLADIVSFKGPHINHLTVGAENIDASHRALNTSGAQAKHSIEGPPIRQCPILLRQTAFKAISEPVLFPDGTGEYEQGSHTARFGEIESRGVALTPKGHALYESLLAMANARNETEPEVLQQIFAEFPDDWKVLRENGLAYFRYHLTPLGMKLSKPSYESWGIEDLLAKGAVKAVPIVYEDFLPVSAAGIFRSNLGDDFSVQVQGDSQKMEFEASLGSPVLDPFDLYQAIETHSIYRCVETLGFGVTEPA